jgi:hypothetical protein
VCVLTSTRITAGQHVAFDPFPSGVRTEARVGRSGPPTEYSFMTGGERDFAKLVRLLLHGTRFLTPAQTACFDLMPSLAEMRPYARSDQSLRVRPCSLRVGRTCLG